MEDVWRDLEGYTEGTYCVFFGTYAKIYTLSDQNENIFYVGCTATSLANRATQHLSEARSNNGNPRKNEIIKGLDFQFKATIIDMIWITGRNLKEAKSKAKEKEHEWINKYRALGYELTNRFPYPQSDKSNNKLEFIGQTFKTTKSSVTEESVRDKGVNAKIRE